MIKDQGVYTTNCPTCTRLILMHVLSDGSISPNKCAHCGTDFAGLEKGNERNTFVVVSGTSKSKFEEKNKAEEKVEDVEEETDIKINIKKHSAHKKNEYQKNWGKNY